MSTPTTTLATPGMDATGNAVATAPAKPGPNGDQANARQLHARAVAVARGILPVVAGENTMPALTSKAFSTGSVGWHSQGKVTLPAGLDKDGNQVFCTYQVNLMLTAIGSK